MNMSHDGSIGGGDGSAVLDRQAVLLASKAAAVSSSRLSLSNRDRCSYKWQRARGVVGALEVSSEPIFQAREPLIPRAVQGREQVFSEALQAWDHFQLRKSFIDAVENVPEETCCCGLLTDDSATKKLFVKQLNEEWAKSANKLLLEKGFKIECFLWRWQNTTGKSETIILLIRFIELSSYRLRRASRDDNLDFELISLDSETLKEVKEEDDDDGVGGGITGANNHTTESVENQPSPNTSYVVDSLTRPQAKQEMARS